MNQPNNARASDRSAGRRTPVPLPDSPSFVAPVVGAIALLLLVALAVGVALDSRRDSAASVSIADGLGLLRLEREVGASWSRVAIANFDHLAFGADSAHVLEALDELRAAVEEAAAALVAHEGTPAWLDTHSRLNEVAEEGLAKLATNPRGHELQAWGWEFAEDFGGIFPSDNRGDWSLLLEVVRDAQYMVYLMGDYPHTLVARALGNGTASFDDPELVRRLESTRTYLDDLAAASDDEEGPFSYALDLARADQVDAEIAAVLAEIKADPLVQAIEGDFAYVTGQSQETWFDRPEETIGFSLEVLDRVNVGGERVLARAESVLLDSRLQAEQRGRLATAAALLGLLMGGTWFVGFWRNRERVDATLRHAAERDPLTGVYNRFALFSRCAPMLDRADRAGFALLHIDLDDFKAINDRYGHMAGDEALRAFAAACRVAVHGHSAIVARVGGDEFVVVLSQLTDIEAAATGVAKRIFKELETAVHSGDEIFHVRATIGVAHSATPIHVDELLEQADAALLEGKTERRSGFSTFTRNTRRNLVKELAEALDTGRIQPAFQPIVRATDLRIVGLEGLARWRRVDGSTVPAADFARALNSVGDHEEWFSVLLDATEETLGLLGESFAGRVWLNVGAADVIRGGDASLPAMIRDRELARERLGLEVMERVCEADLHGTRRILTELRESGVQVALDDLGSDGIPMRHLADLPLDRIKIDGSLVERIDQSETRRRVLEGLMAVAINLGLTVVGERVETKAEERTLTQLGVTYLQGHLYSPALTTDELVDFFARHERQRRLGATA